MPRVASTRRDPQFNYVLYLAQGRPVFTADYYSVDGGTGKVGSFIDWNDASHTLVQSGGSFQVAIPAIHADFKGKLCATFTGAEFYDSNRSIFTWRFLHESTPGMGVYVSLTPTETSSTYYYVNTRASSGIGFTLVFTASSYQSVVYQPSNGVVATAGTTPTVGVPIQFGYQYLEGAAPSEYYVKATNSSVSTGNSLLSPAGGDSASTLRLGARISGTNFLKGRWRHLIFTPFNYSGLNNVVQQFITYDSGIAA